MIRAQSGTLLIAEPFLQDPNFARTTVLVCQHNEEGTVGLVLNRPLGKDLDYFLPELTVTGFPVFQGGPVQAETLHMLHRLSQFKPVSYEVAPGLYYGGPFEDILEQLTLRKISTQDIRFFLGYSGWGYGQLEAEMAADSWLAAPVSEQLIFSDSPETGWHQAVKTLDKKFHQILNYPTNPQLN